jgi:hypothetical protein
LDIPLKIRLPIELRSINDYRIAHFQDNNLQNPKPHWYVLIPITGTDEFLVIMITSKKRERIEYYKKTKQPKAACCLVSVSNDEFSFLNRDSAINCNDAEHLTIKDIVHRVDDNEGFKLEKENVPAYLRREIVSAIIKSPLQSKAIEQLAKASNPA